MGQKSSQKSLSELHGVGDAMLSRLADLGLHTVEDLVWYRPRLHEDLSQVTDLIDLHEGEKLTVRGTIDQIASRPAWRRRRMSITEALITDDTASAKVIWFNQPYLAQTLKVGDLVQLSGVAKRGKYGLSLQSPVYEKLYGGSETTHTGRIVPLYPLTQGLTQKQIRYFIKQALASVLPLPETLPAEVVTQFGLLSLSEALQQIHFPETPEQQAAAERRLNFDQLLLTQLYAQLQRRQLQTQPANRLPIHEPVLRDFVASLPFTLTDGQRQAIWKIVQDMDRDQPMNRLLIGDVGSGKTVVAAAAIRSCIAAGFQAVLMAPTEILARQHFATMKTLLEPSGATVELRTASSKPKRVAAGQTQLGGLAADLTVGTHALIQEGMQFDRLALAVVDEQHRFGVAQRRRLKEISGDAATLPHLLSLTATPIPRTLALALYGDLDLTTLREKPVGRKPIVTRLIPPNKRLDAYDFIRQHVADGEQVFVLCPLIDPSDTLGIRSATEEYDRLRQEVFPDLRIGLLHGKLKSHEKDEVMAAMRAKTIDLLVATSVIEVGVDIPDATIMLVEGAERFGLAQLHQFRGRVGRSDRQSYCLLFTSSAAGQSLARLKALTTQADGFALAELDLAQRGAGEVFGTIQSGFSDTAVIAVQQPALLEEARLAAETIIQKQWLGRNPTLQAQLEQFSATVHLE